MANEYTEMMKNRLEEMASTANITPGINLMGAIRELEALRSRNLYPARFQLMQFIESQPHTYQSEGAFSVAGPVSDRIYTFARTDEPDSAQLKDCVAWLVERASSLSPDGGRGEGYYRRAFTALIEKNGWMRYRESDQRYLNRTFDRHYAYEMGHCLGFTLEQMQRFLDRVLPDEIYINKDAEDLAEAYAFGHGKSQDSVARVLAAYHAAAQEMPSQFELIDIGNTHQLYEEAAAFDGTEEEFISWLAERSPVLEGRSRTAFAVYRNLLICAWLMMRALYHEDCAVDDPVSALWEACIENGEDMAEYYAQNRARFGLPEYESLDWKKVAEEFDGFSEWAPSENRERRYPRDFLLYLSVDRDGNFVTENTFSRIPRIMQDGRPVQKRDVLCLLWLIYIFAWEDVAPEDVAGQLHDFIDLATGILEQCNFTFYLPHLLEYSICRSLIIGGDMEDAYRSVIRQGDESPLCEEFCLRDRRTGARYGVRFYTCEQYTFREIRDVLYAHSRGEDLHVYNDTWKNVELWLTKADRQLQCGWERVTDVKRIAEFEALGRIIDLPDSL